MKNIIKSLSVFLLMISVGFITSCKADAAGLLVVNSISVTSLPTKISYVIDDIFDATGMEVTATYDNGSQKIVKGWSVTGFDTSTFGSKKETLIVTFGGKSTTFDYDIIISKYKFHETVEELPEGTAGPDGKYVYFGDWPQSVLPLDTTIEVNEDAKITMGSINWCLGSDGDWYTKCIENAYETSYKYKDNSDIKQKGSNSYRWFKAEPIKWCVVTENYNNKEKRLLLAENILTANVPYYNFNSQENTRTVESDSDIYPNNYKYSQIRAYLNGLEYYYDESNSSIATKTNYSNKGFLQSAFTSSAQNLIETTNVDNGEDSTTDYESHLTKATVYVCENTSDKIFLLSESEVSNINWHFDRYTSYESGNRRIREPTDYAKANRAYEKSSAGYWWLRSPSSSAAEKARRIGTDGNANSEFKVSSTNIGVVPALCVD